MRMRYALLLALGLLLSATQSAHASTCRERLALFVEEYRLDGVLFADPPIAATRPPPVIEPQPRAPATALPEPNAGSAERRQDPKGSIATAPTRTTEVPVPPVRKEIGPAERATLEALIAQARAADARGDEAECFEQVGEAISEAERAGLRKSP